MNLKQRWQGLKYWQKGAVVGAVFGLLIIGIILINSFPY